MDEFILDRFEIYGYGGGDEGLDVVVVVVELLLIEIPKHMNDTNLSFLDELLPWAPGIQEKCPSRYKKS